MHTQNIQSGGKSYSQPVHDICVDANDRTKNAMAL